MLADAHISILGYLWLERLDVARLTVNDGHLDFQMYRGAGAGIIALVGGGGGEKNIFLASSQTAPAP